MADRTADRRTGRGTDTRERELPEHVTTPLLTLITARSMDEDYAHVARKRAAAGDAPARADAAALGERRRGRRSSA